MDIKMFGQITNAFGPSGFEEEAVRTVAGYCQKFELENDSMTIFTPECRAKEGKPVVQLDAHLDECGFMVQSIRENGALGF